MTALAGLLMRRSDQGASPLDRRREPNGTTRSSNRPQARTVATHEAAASGMDLRRLEVSLRLRRGEEVSLRSLLNFLDDWQNS